MFTSRTFVIFLIPMAIFGLFLWFAATLDIDSGDVRVAGTLISPTDMELSVTSSQLTESNGSRKLVVEMESRNNSSTNINLDPKGFQLILASNENPAASSVRHSIYNPMHYSSVCDQAPNSLSSIPPDAVRSMTLIFWGENLPRGDEWEDYHLSLEYYDTSNQIMISKLIKPSQE